MTRTQQALEELNKAIDAGREFPDVVYHIAVKHKVHIDELAIAYDRQISKRS